AIKAIGEAQSQQVSLYVAAVEKAQAAGQQPPSSPASLVTPFALYNGNIHPLAPFPIRGVLWYQGESNLGDGMSYAKKMKGMIQSWRSVWAQGDFPFLYVQLAPYNQTIYGRGNVVLEFVQPEIWEAQAAVLRSVENTGMCVTTDIGNLADIHPLNKEEVGRRLALWALAKTYGRTNLVYSGPIYQSMKIEGSKIRLEFEYVGEGLASRDGQPLNWFQIAAGTNAFVEATAVIDGSPVVVSSDQVPNPTAVRFGWHEAAQPNLINKAGLPASPFRTGR
ncbi:MAG: 9-O-acetylesterase, partial [Proteobacteria bacterium]|nr:9-O-acetylesterase [Pseudomonadota bacterium]